MYAATATKKSLVTCKVYSHLFIYFDPESHTDMNVEPAEHRHLMSFDKEVAYFVNR